MTRWLALVLLLPSLAVAQPKEPTVEELVAQLGHKSFAVREKAMVALRTKGPGVLPALKKAQTTSDAEVRERLAMLIPELEKIAALTPKKITLAAKQQTVTEIIKDINKQTGFNLMVNPGLSPPRYDLECNEMPFWEAMLLVQQRTGYGISNNQYSKALQLEKIPVAPRYVVNHGPVRLELVHLHEDRDAFFKQAGMDHRPLRTHLLTFQFMAYVEPRYHIHSIPDMEMTLANDEEGKPYERRKNTTEEYNSSRWGSLFIGQTKLQLLRTNENAKKVRELRGTVPVNLVVERKNILVSDNPSMANGTKFRIGNDSLQVTRCQVTGNNIDVEIRIPPTDGRRDANNWHERMVVEDEAGIRYTPSGRGTSSSGDNDYRISVYFYNQGGKAGPPKKIFVEEWVTIPYAVPFDFKDIVLP